jgi:hypothetical protein
LVALRGAALDVAALDVFFAAAFAAFAALRGAFFW